MITDDEVMRVLERADPARVEDPIPMLDADGYLDALRSSHTKLTLIGLEPTRAKSGPRRRSRRVTHGVLAIAVAAAVVTTLVVISRDHTTAPADIPIPVPSLLEEPSPDEVAAASNAAWPATGSPFERATQRRATEVTATRNYVSLRMGPDGWAYATGSANSPEVHYGMLGHADQLVLSPLDDRLFVASPAAFSQDPQAVPPAWLIDSATGQRGPLRWVDQPTAMDSAEQVLALSAPQPNQPRQQFLPRVVDKRDWTIGPLSVPEDAAAAVEIHQPGGDRIWIGTAPDGGDVGLAYTDDGGASWTDVELPEALRRTSDQLSAAEEQDLLVLAASGDNVAVAARWVRSDSRLFASADAGETWDVVPVNDYGQNGRRLFVMDERLVFAVSSDYYLRNVFVSNPSDWSRLEEIEDLPYPRLPDTSAVFDFDQRGVASLYNLQADESIFSTDLSDWWSIPSLPDERRNSP